MATFTSFNDRLPDPTFSVNDAGVVAASGNSGPGFASISFTSNRPAQVSKTNSGRGIHRETGAHNWAFTITYNPMKRDQFDVVNSFLEFRNGRLRPFFVVLPQHSRPRDALFAAFADVNILTASGAQPAGTSVLMIAAPTAFVSSAKFGDYFTISDPADVNHLKTYKVTAVETNSNWQSGTVQPATNQLKLHIMPPLTRSVTNGAKINFINPAFRVIQTSDTLEYQLSTDNLYEYQLSLEEILP